MKDPHNLRASLKGRSHQARRHGQQINLILGKSYVELTDGDIADLRDLSADLNQCIHEMNAYRNALEWNDRETGRTGD